jgi:hypothetical protein
MRKLACSGDKYPQFCGKSGNGPFRDQSVTKSSLTWLLQEANFTPKERKKNPLLRF